MDSLNRLKECLSSSAAIKSAWIKPMNAPKRIKDPKSTLMSYHRKSLMFRRLQTINSFQRW